MEICPNCGDDTPSLDDRTGWCDKCSAPYSNSICERCGQESDNRKVCRRCRESIWLENHGDEIDRFLAEGLSVAAAKRLAHETSKIELTCRRCQSPMKKPPYGQAFFCTSNNDCRSANNKFRRLVYKKKMDREEAVVKILEDEGQSRYKETA